MGAVEIVCLGDSAYIPDLGIRLDRGAKTSVSLEVASASNDLEAARAIGLVGVQVVKAHVIRREGGRFARHVEVAPPAAQAATPQAPFDAALLQAIRELTAEVRGLRSELKGRSHEPPDLGKLGAEIRSALMTLGQGLASPQISSTPSESPVAPMIEEMFIPTGIVPKDAKAEISIETSTEAIPSSVDDAQVALRKARRSKESG